MQKYFESLILFKGINLILLYYGIKKIATHT